MEVLALLSVLILFGVPAGVVYAVVRVHSLRGEIEEMKQSIGRLERLIARVGAETARGRARPEDAAGTERHTEGAAAPSAASDAGSSVGTDAEPRVEARRPRDPVTASRSTRGPAAAAPPESTSPSEPAAVDAAGPDAPAEEPRHEEPEAESPAEEPRPGDPEPTAERPGEARDEPQPTPAAAGLDLETAIGTTWLLRIGLGILAIALALFARSVAPQLSPAGKVAAAYAGSIAFFTLGKVFEKRLDRFARPVMAGGLAFGFFVAFASYFVPPMRAVPMPVSVAWMVASMFTVLVAAERWRSEPTAIIAIVLGHVSAQVTAGAADVYSLVMIGFLAVTALALLLRHRWVGVGLLGVTASYGAHLLWLLADRPIPAGNAGFWLSVAFLTSYYVIFLVADVLWWLRSDQEAEEGPGAAASGGTRTTDSNAERGEEAEAADALGDRLARALGPANLMLYVALTSFVYFVSGASLGSIEWYFLTLGSLQGALAWLYWRTSHHDFVFYPVFGTVLWTLGFFAALDALVLNMVLAAQAILLLLAAHRTGLRVFYLLAQAAMAVAFVHYLVYPPPTIPTVPAFLGGLGIAAVYVAKAALEEEWYPSTPVVAIVHAILGGVVAVREAESLLGADPALAPLLLVVTIGALTLSLGLRRTSLLFTVTILAAGSLVVLEPTLTETSFAALAMLGGLSASAAALLLLAPRRFGQEELARCRGHALALAGAALVGGFLTTGALSPATTVYLTWLLLPAFLVAFGHVAESTNVPAPEEEAGAAVRPTSDRPVVLTLAVGTALFVVALTQRVVPAIHDRPLFAATASLVLFALAGTKLRRGVSAAVTAFSLLLAGYATLLFLYYGAYGAPHPAMASWWAGPYLAVVPLLAAVALDRRLSRSASPDDPDSTPADRSRSPESSGSGSARRPITLGVVLTTYGTAFVTFSLLADGLLPTGWTVALPALVFAALAWRAGGIEAPLAVAAAALFTALAHGVFLTTLQVPPTRPGFPVEDALLPLLLFSVMTLVVERLARASEVEELQIEAAAHALAAVVVLSVLTAMAAIDGSALLGGTWTTAGWSVLAGSIMAAGFALRSSLHRRVALVLVGVCIVRVFVIDTAGLSETARIGAFFVLGVILVAIALLYTRYSEELKSWL